MLSVAAIVPTKRELKGMSETDDGRPLTAELKIVPMKREWKKGS